MINNRQAGRRRGRGGQQQRSQGGNPGRLDTGNRIDNRARGNAAQLLEKYKTLARDAQMQGDRVNVEYYLQFADHYFRVLAETRARIEENGGPVQRRIQGATLDEDDTEFEDEGERVLPAEQARGGQNGYRQDGRQDGNRSEGSRSEGSRSEGSRQDNNRSDNNRQDAPRQDGGRQDGYRQDNARQDGNRNEPRQDTRGDGERGYQRNGNRANADLQNGQADSRGNEEQNDRPRRGQNGAGHSEGGSDRQRDQPRVTEDRYVQAEEPTLDLAPVSEQQAAPVQTEAHQTDATPIEAVEPPRRGRGRPRRDAAAVPAAASTEHTDASDDNSFSADLLPPSLNVSAVVPDGSDAEGAEKPRRRRGRPPIVRETDPVA